MSLTDAEKAEIRRHCGYPAYGSGAKSFQGWRFDQAYGMMEYRMIRMSGTEEAMTRQYLATLTELETAIPQAGAMLDTNEAAVWKRSPRELRERIALLDDWRRRLCGFLGLPPGPAIGANMRKDFAP